MTLDKETVDALAALFGYSEETVETLNACARFVAARQKLIDVEGPPICDFCGYNDSLATSEDSQRVFFQEDPYNAEIFDVHDEMWICQDCCYERMMEI